MPSSTASEGNGTNDWVMLQPQKDEAEPVSVSKPEMVTVVSVDVPGTLAQCGRLGQIVTGSAPLVSGTPSTVGHRRWMSPNRGLKRGLTNCKRPATFCGIHQRQMKSGAIAAARIREHQ
jgi:hypothetical protein